MIDSSISNAAISMPYNFTRGRNTVVNITPAVITSRNTDPLTAPDNFADTRNETSGALLTPNRLAFTIPTGVTTFDTTMEVRASQRIIAGTTGAYTWQRSTFTVQITCDLINNIITITPQSRTGNFNNTVRPVAVLLTVQTII